MKIKHIAATGLAVTLAMASVQASYADVSIKGETVTDSSYTGDIEHTSTDSAVDVNGGDKFSVKGNIDQTGGGAAVSVSDSGSEVKVDGNITSDGKGVVASEGSATVTGDIQAKENAIRSTNGDVKVEGDVTSTGSFKNTIDNDGGDVTVTGNVSKENNGYSYAVHNKNGDTTVNGDISTTGKGVFNENGNVLVDGKIEADSAAIENRKDGNVTVNGDVTSEAPRTGHTISNAGGNVTVNGDVTASTWSAIKNSTGGTTTVNGDVSSKDAALQNYGGTVVVNGNVKNETAYQYAIINHNGDTTINGNLQAQAEAVFNSDGKVTVKGDVSTETSELNDRGGHYSGGIRNVNGTIVIDGNVSTEAGTRSAIEQFSSEATINGNVTSKGKDGIISRLGSNITVNGDVTSAGNGVQTDYSSKTIINGDIIAEEAGLEIERINHGLVILHTDEELEEFRNGPANTIIVDGTITSKTSRPIVYWTDSSKTDDGSLDKMPTIIVYAVESEAGKPLVKAPISSKNYNAARQKAKEEQIADSINYIIRRGDSENATYDLQNTRMLEGYETARAKETIIINVSAAKGYTVSSIKGGQAVATKRSDGVWELTVPDGGGVTISVLMKAIEEAEREGATEKVITGNRGNSSKAETTADYIVDKVAVSSNGAVFGAWTADGGYEVNGVRIRSQWVKIFIKEINAAVWFYFDENGNKLTGWQRLRGENGKERWYYLSEKPGNLLGACYINSKTPDGYNVNSDGAWAQGGIVQEYD